MFLGIRFISVCITNVCIRGFIHICIPVSTVVSTHSFTKPGLNSVLFKFELGSMGVRVFVQDFSGPYMLRYVYPKYK